MVAVFARDYSKAAEATDLGARAGHPLTFSTEPEEYRAEGAAGLRGAGAAPNSKGEPEQAGGGTEVAALSPRMAVQQRATRATGVARATTSRGSRPSRHKRRCFT